jgi:phosphoserine phosphatase
VKLVVLDVDRTLASFAVTSTLYKRMFLSPPSLRHLGAGALMLSLMHGLWFWRRAVALQRRIVMTLFAEADPGRLQAHVDELVSAAAADYEAVLKPRLKDLLEGPHVIYLVSHCPTPLALGLVERLGFAGQFSVQIGNYFGGSDLRIYSKVEALDELRSQHPDAEVHYFADDLVDLACLRRADVGVVVNGSAFTRLWCRLMNKDLEIWS